MAGDPAQLVGRHLLLLDLMPGNGRDNLLHELELINITKGLRVDRARQFAADCRDSGSLCTGPSSWACPERRGARARPPRPPRRRRRK